MIFNRLLGISIVVFILSACGSESNKKDISTKDNETTKSATSRSIKGFSGSEGITSDGNYYFVSNIGKDLAPTKKDGDGFISRLDLNGDFLDLMYIGSGDLNAPKGLAVLNNVLYIADIDRLVGYDLDSVNRVFEIIFDNTSFLNAIDVIDNNTLFVSATDANLLFKVNVNDKTFTEVDLSTKLLSPNGLCYDQENDLLYVVGSAKEKGVGRIGVLNLSNGESFTQLLEENGMFDGIKLFENKLFVTDWADGNSGRLFSFDPATGLTKNIPMPETMKGPAEFYINKNKKEIWIPRLLESTVLVTELGN